MHATRTMETYDTIVIGGGVAGLFTALLAAEAGSVLVLAKERLSESNSSRAQGGVAVAMREDDAPRRHAEDTLAAGADFAHSESVKVLTEEGSRRIGDLMRLGVPFDRLPDSQELAWGREGAHRLPRILHAGGDATGASIVGTLVKKAREHPRIELLEARTAVSILMEDGVASGVAHVAGRKGSAAGAEDPSTGCRTVRARFVVLATGGAGQLFARTTNPPIATGDGLLLGYRCGAVLADLEMFQFHPTALALPEAPPFLLSEAMRGEGGVLRNAAGRRFAAKYHPDGELAPRDVVSRAILSELSATGDPTVFLDVTHLNERHIRDRFPTIHRECGKFGLDITADLVPVAPAAHYFMGGVWTNLWGQTTVPGLFACGEVACTGVHGANRLAGNSLLEALVFGRRVAQAVRGLEGRRQGRRWDVEPPDESFVIKSASRTGDPPELPDSTAQVSGNGDREPLRPIFLPAEPDPERLPGLDPKVIQNLAWQHLGPERSGNGLRALLHALAPQGHAGDDIPGLHRPPPPHPSSRTEAEREAPALLARLMARAALAREESRGAHYRSDHPHPRPEWRRHILVRAADANADTTSDA